MSDAKGFAKLAANKHLDITVSDAIWMHKMACDGDLVHIDGAFVTALNDLADRKFVEYAGCTVSRKATRDPEYVIAKDGLWTTADSALVALIVAEESREHQKMRRWEVAADDDEPEIPTYDEALGAKCDREEALRRQLRDAGRL